MVMLDFIYMGSADLFRTEGSEKFKMKIFVFSGMRTHTTPVHDRKVSALDRSDIQFKCTCNHNQDDTYCHVTI